MASLASSISEQLIQVFHNALIDVEASAGVSPDDPALLVLKSIILQRIADLQLAKAQAAASDASTIEFPNPIESELSTEAA